MKNKYPEAFTICHRYLILEASTNLLVAGGYVAMDDSMSEAISS